MSVWAATCICASALLGALAFVCSAACWWVVFIFLIPLFVRVARELPSRAWREGLLWGALFFGVQSVWLFFLMWYKTDCPSLGLLLALLFVGYCALHGALWFAGATLFTRLYNCPACRVCAWIGLGLLVFYWLERGAFWVTGQWDGYPLVQPLLPLAERPALLFFLPLLGSYGLLAAIFGFAGAVALLITTRHWIYIFPALVCMVPFLFGMLWWQPGAIHSCSNKICYLSPVCTVGGAYEQAEAIAGLLANIHQAHPAIDTFIMPESTLGIALNDYPQFMVMWDAALLHDEVSIILGAHQHCNKEWYNTLYCVHRGTIAATHTKTHCVPFVEYMPFPWSLLLPLYTLFLGDCYSFARHEHEREVVPLLNDCYVLPYICSELYFSYEKPVVSPTSPLLCLVNDSWFVSYARRLLFLSARLKAIAWQRDILYVGHYGAYLFSGAGNCQPITCGNEH